MRAAFGLRSSNNNGNSLTMVGTPFRLQETVFLSQLFDRQCSARGFHCSHLLGEREYSNPAGTKLLTDEVAGRTFFSLAALWQRDCQFQQG